MNLNIVITVPFANAENEAAIWAREEARIDFRRDPERAARCTTAFAAVELKHFFQRCLYDTAISIQSKKAANGLCIELRIADPCSKSESFDLEPVTNGVVVRGQGRTGVLYGAYELLRMQGWRWYAPGPSGEIAPPGGRNLVLPLERRRYAPSMDLGRGFSFEGDSEESAELLIWMARNRLNLSGYRHATGPLGEKLGMRAMSGGHIFGPLLDPDQVQPSGKTLWEEHPDWYGLPPDGSRVKARALDTQFCVSNPELVAFLCGRILDLAMGGWKGAEHLSISGFDTWGSVCQCEGCRKIGGGTEQTLHFMSALRRYLDAMRRENRLDHDCVLTTWAYEGTGNLEGPRNAIPPNLIAAGDYFGFAPIKRCYAHDFKDHQCPDNAIYNKALASWFKPTPRPLMTICEYYNVSKYEDLPLLFTTRIARDLPAYYEMGARGMSYMHLPLVNWGMRTLTQVLYAQLCWDVHTDVAIFLDEYFSNWYGPYGATMRRAYEQVEQAWRLIGSWRNWGDQSILSQLLAWDGARPKGTLAGNEHLPTPDAMIGSGRESCRLLEEAARLVNESRRANRSMMAAGEGGGGGKIELAVNPVEARRMPERDALDMRLGEDHRSLIYGLDTMRLMTEMVAYHDAIFRNDAQQAESAWKIIERTADSLDSRYLPIGYADSGPGLVSQDALTRSQLRGVIRRCHADRLRSHNGNYSGIQNSEVRIQKERPENRR